MPQSAYDGYQTRLVLLEGRSLYSSNTGPPSLTILRQPAGSELTMPWPSLTDQVKKYPEPSYGKRSLPQEAMDDSYPRKKVGSISMPRYGQSSTKDQGAARNGPSLQYTDLFHSPYESTARLIHPSPFQSRGVESPTPQNVDPQVGYTRWWRLRECRGQWEWRKCCFLEVPIWGLL